MGFLKYFRFLYGTVLVKQQKKHSVYFSVLPHDTPRKGACPYPPFSTVCLGDPPLPGDARSVVSELEAAVNAKPGAHHVWNDPSVPGSQRVRLGFLEGFAKLLDALLIAFFHRR